MGPISAIVPSFATTGLILRWQSSRTSNSRSLSAQLLLEIVVSINERISGPKHICPNESQCPFLATANQLSLSFESPRLEGLLTALPHYTPSCHAPKICKSVQTHTSAEVESQGAPPYLNTQFYGSRAVVVRASRQQNIRLKVDRLVTVNPPKYCLRRS